MLTKHSESLKYSVLMPVYVKEHPDNLRRAIESMLSQTLLPDQIVLACDGELTNVIDKVVDEYAERESLGSFTYAKMRERRAGAKCGNRKIPE